MNPNLYVSDAVPGGKVADIDFKVFKAFDQKTGQEVAVFKRAAENVWQWKSAGDNNRFVLCPDAVAADLETLYKAFLSKQIVE